MVAASGNTCSTSGQAVGTVKVTCVTPRQMAFNVSSTLNTKARLSYWVGCAAPNARRCSSWNVLPEPGPINNLGLSITADASRKYTSWQQVLPASGCSCDKLFWSVTQAGTFVGTQC